MTAEQPSESVHGSPYSGGETCHVCEVGPARHKVGEEDARPNLHNYTAYLCCTCFGVVMGRVAQRECWAVAASAPSEQS